MENNIGFNQSGVLLLKNIIEKIEYHLYDKNVPKSEDINETLNLHLYNTIRKQIHIVISDYTNIMFEGVGKLKKKFENGLEKFYLTEINESSNHDNIETVVDLELLLFNLVDDTINIKINTVHNEETDEVKEGENKVNGLQES